MSYATTSPVRGDGHDVCFPALHSCSTRLVRAASWKMIALACAMLIAFAAVAARAQTYHDLYDFDCGDGNGGPGCQPNSKGQLAQGSDGNLYGTTDDEGAYEIGTIFVVSPDGSYETDLWSFDYTTGAYPNAALTLASDGNFYGTAFGGGDFGDGTVFRFTPPGTITVLHSFTDGADGGAPWSPPVEAADGNLYGVTGLGTAYRITLPAGTFQALPHKTPAGPIAPLVLGLDGNLYGATEDGGKHNKGTVFRMTTAGAIKIIYSFSGPDGSGPTSPLTYGSGGNLVGTTLSGGANNTGTIFKLTLAGQLTTLHNFGALFSNTNSDGASPLAGLLYASDGNFYGPTPLGGADGNGTLFQITPTGSFTKVYDFTQGNANGSEAWTTLMEHTNGSYYGLTTESGTNFWGNVYSLVPATPIQILKVAGPIFLKPGTQVEILGNDLTHVVSLTFGLVGANYQIGSDTFLVATVPNGAVDGVIAATLQNGEQIKTHMAVYILPVISSLNPTSGPVGSKVNIIGGGLTGATQVTFGGGVKATNFTVVSATTIQATVPAGAKSGKVKVTTPHGTATSTQRFTVK